MNFRSILNVNDPEFLKLGLEIKHFNSYNLDIIKYNKNESDMTNEYVKKWRSVIVNLEQNKILAISPDKSINIDETNKKFLQKLRDTIGKEKTIVISVAGKTLKQIEETINFFKDYNLYVYIVLLNTLVKIQI